MHRTRYTLGLILLIVGLLGCPQNPATMTQGQIEEMLKKELSLQSITLTASPDGSSYSGTGQGPDKANVKIKVTRDEKERKLTYEGESDSGDVKSGSLQLK